MNDCFSSIFLLYFVITITVIVKRIFTNDIRFAKLPILIISIYLFTYCRYIFNERVKSKGLGVGINLNRKSRVATFFQFRPLSVNELCVPIAKSDTEGNCEGRGGRARWLACHTYRPIPRDTRNYRDAALR